MKLDDQNTHINHNVKNISTKFLFSNISNNNEKNLSLFSKSINLEHREFGNDITNIALTAFEKNNLVSNKSILKAIEIIKANMKNKERSREKSLIKNRSQILSKNKKNNSKDEKKRQNWKMAVVDKKRTKNETKNNYTNKNELISTKNKSDETNKNFKKENNINISEFNYENNEKNDSFWEIKENLCQNEFMGKITEINIQIDKNNIPLNHFLHKSISSYNDQINRKFNMQYVEEYQEEIIEYLLSLENEKRINPNYMKEQKDINEKMRIILIDWLIEVHLKFKLLPETLFLTINFIDRYLQKNQTSRDKLQLIAVSSLLIASKYEEIYPPEISSFVYITDNAYKIEDLLNFELKILESLEYDVTYPTPLRYMEILIVKLGLNKDEIFYHKMQYLLELSLSRLIFYNYTYFELVLACGLFLYENDFNMTKKILLCFDLYDKQEKLWNIKSCIYEIKKLLEYANENKISFKGLKQKYSLEKYGCVSKMKFL